MSAFHSGKLKLQRDGSFHERDGAQVKTQAKFFAALLLFSLCLVPRGFADAGDPPNRVARLSYMDDAVSFEAAGENDWSQATLNYPLTTGDRLWTDVNARAELETGNVAIRMSQQTDLTTTNLTDQLIQLGLAQGSLRVRVLRFASRQHRRNRYSQRRDHHHAGGKLSHRHLSGSEHDDGHGQ